ncbi:MAG: 30S ribosomal protein S12 methylthiotransferase RimO [Chlorobium phaeobacteroides]|uniref:Ribosomal protein uS12 methylthiotransferase RimO n=1 Tax=Chlorobium phaeobacteroides (strain BS1) TaxID=331678 RepID=RIMO_CHLPB|nr:RecName: Full=Ribosomal protein uS12 methylthiotransferase RimO; Short=uS12 MTTase; Short=uS12 methylthiotransferase; AltName: Full=Ribosomal protein uS12 (aspartate-C(3))-methylthiotransferase; AltName: Full=Ribosome maturation factor RimO [Chlorobium phaeobacteroides BS1]MBL6956251.1 30S ribosomal protein S12 methylthiotransferase RimO [Chlorobium phaeobacteroides]
MPENSPETMTRNRSIFLLSLGCSKNTVDSERLIGQARRKGLSFTNEPDEADIVIINTCGFIADAKTESIDEILAAAEKRKNGEIEALYVMGCLSALYAAELRAELPEVDRFFGTADLPEILNILGTAYDPATRFERSLLSPSHYAWLKLSEGCSRTCSFCAIPKMRGRYKSESMEDLLQEATRLKAKGVKELNLIAQDITPYGLDLYGTSRLNDLMRELSDLNFDWIRLLYAYPLDFPLEVIDTMRERENICDYLDMPVQHICDRILASMKRGIDKQGTIGLLESIRKRNPNIRLRTTMIVGYPGETRAEFEELLQFVREFRFDRLGCFPYSHEEHTAAYDNLEDDIPEEEKQERVGELMELQEGISEKKNRALEEKALKVLVEEVEDNLAFARTEYDAPEVDNECVLDTAGIDIRPGDFCMATIEESSAYELVGRIKNVIP